MAKTILVVEDFDDIREAIKILIELHGYRVIEATDGHEAVEMTREHRPDLILMDLSMPAFDGITATREIRSFPELSRVPIVAITSYETYYTDEALAAGCIAVIEKTQFMQNIIGEIEKYLG